MVIEEGDTSPCHKRKNTDSESAFEGFIVKKVLKEVGDRKLIFIHGQYQDDPEAADAVVILEKTGFQADQLGELLSATTKCEKVFKNDIYSNLLSFPPAHLNAIKTTVVYPATEKHLEKYMDQKLHVMEETRDDYDKIVVPHIQSQALGLQWVYNILEKTCEADRIVFEDADKDTGFILLPDLKWDGQSKESLYLMAVCHRRDITCLRDLQQEHLPLLRNMLSKGKLAITERYGVKSDELRVYIHYHPSYYHFHVHFTYVKYEGPGQQFDKAHSLLDVIDNLSLYPLYYQNRTLSYLLKDNETLFKAFLSAQNT